MTNANVVRELAAGKGFVFAEAGEVVPKGFDEAVRLYEVRWREDLTPDPFPFNQAQGRPKGKGDEEA